MELSKTHHPQCDKAGRTYLTNSVEKLEGFISAYIFKKMVLCVEESACYCIQESKRYTHQS